MRLEYWSQTLPAFEQVSEPWTLGFGQVTEPWTSLMFLVCTYLLEGLTCKCERFIYLRGSNISLYLYD